MAPTSPVMDSPLAAPVPELPSPWRTEARLALQAEARRFATKEVFPLANRLDPVKGDIPRSFLDRIGEQGYFGIMIPAEFGGMGLGVFEYCMIAEELARAWMSVGVDHRPGPGHGHAVRRCRRPAGAAGAQRPRGVDRGGGLPSPTPGRTWPTSRRGRCSTATSGSSPARSAGRASPWRPTSSRCCAGSPTPNRASRGSAGLASIVVEKERGAFPAGVEGRPLDKIGYHGFSTWNLTLDAVRVPAANRLGEGSSSDLALRPRRRLRGRRRPLERGPGPHRRPGRRAGPGGARGLRALRPGAGAVRAAHRRLPGRPVHDRRDGRPDRSGPELLPPGRPPHRRGRPPASEKRRWSSCWPPRWPPR